MKYDLVTRLQETDALLDGHFRLSSGLHSRNYVQCARLLEHPRDATVIGEALAGFLRDLEPQKIVAPALGGVIIGYTVAQALDVPMVFTERKEGEMTLRRGFEVQPGERCVVVEDVVTTGKSTMEAVRIVEERGGVVAGIASILNRSGRKSPFDREYRPLLNVAFETYSEADCPLCRDAVPIDAPGSRFSQRA
jgi:orotate phosphoribosyltransferase